MNERYEEFVFREGFRRGYEKGKADRPKGEWIADYEAGFKTWECSECGIHMLSDWNFCPNCGADMRGEDNE